MRLRSQVRAWGNGDYQCPTCYLRVSTSYKTRHDAAGCAARVGLVKDHAGNSCRIMLEDYMAIAAVGSYRYAPGHCTEEELEAYLSANFPVQNSWNKDRVPEIVAAFINQRCTRILPIHLPAKDRVNVFRLKSQQ